MTNGQCENLGQRGAPAQFCRRTLSRFQSTAVSILRLQLVSLLVLAACTEQAPPLIRMVGASGQEPQTIAVRSMPYKDVSNWQEPLRGAGSGAATGAGQALGENAECAGGTGLLCIALLPIFVVVGAIGGAIVSHSDEEVMQATAVLKNTIASATPVIGVEQAVIDQLRATPAKHYEVRALSERELGLSYAQLAEEGVDAVLELQVSHLDLVIFGRIDPDAAVNFLVRADVVDTSTGPTKRSLSWAYLDTRYDYFEMSANNAHLLRGSIERSYKEVAELIVADLFSSGTVAIAAPEITQEPGEKWVFEIMEGQSPSSADRQIVWIVDSKLSVNVSTNGWRGNISGEIDHLGNLAGTGTIKRMGYTPRTFEFSASQSNGAFHTSVVIDAQSGSVTTITIELARQQL